jgi:hypothetical protein
MVVITLPGLSLVLWRRLPQRFSVHQLQEATGLATGVTCAVVAIGFLAPGSSRTVVCMHRRQE